MSIYISGNISGLGNPGYYINLSRRQAFNPMLICQEQGYKTNECPIAAIEYEGFSPNKIINIRSREGSYYENTADYHKSETLIYNGTNYPILHYPFNVDANEKLKYLVTDYDNNYFQYELLYNAFSSASGIVIKNIYKNNETILDKKEYKIQCSYDLLSAGTARYSNTTWGNSKNASIHRVRVLLPYSCSSKKDFYVIDYDKSLLGVTTYQKELIELRPLYDATDYQITSSGLNILSNSRINNNGSTLSIIKDPSYIIAPLDIVTLKGQNSYLSDKDAQWKLRLNIGAFQISSGFYTGLSGNIYNLENVYTESNIPLTNIRPSSINKSIIQLKETPIYINETDYSYPSYIVNLYDKTNSGLLDSSGKLAIDVNGVTRSDIKIKSIDRQKGFIELNTNLSITDEIEVSFYLSNSGFIILENLELNPKISQDGGFAFHIKNYPNGLGIALAPWTDGTEYPFIYDLATDPSTRVASRIYDIGDTSTYSEAWDKKFFTICEIDLNKLTPDMVKITDARRIGGGVKIDKMLDEWFSLNLSGIHSYEKTWYADNGNYDGAPLSGSSMIIIHVPDDLITSSKQQWIDYFKTYTTIDSAEVLAEKEFKHYLDQSIRRYMSAGTDYIIMPTVSGCVTGKILNLGH